MITDDLELPIRHIPITGPGVDALNNRKEVGSPVEITGAELRESLERVKEGNLRALRMLVSTPIHTR